MHYSTIYIFNSCHSIDNLEYINTLENTEGQLSKCTIFVQIPQVTQNTHVYEV